ncbi:MAG: DNA-3-methyladenine glycosylase [Candidatus Margulisbacteria bacterium]|nr:DNA-3-methyladenine glycosylase [Candidatus Margulisiibacteriota bacterium]
MTGNFYRKPTSVLARALLGKILIYQKGRQFLAARIVETEAYLFQNDPACHARGGRTRRNAPMFGPPGRTYVYLIYGMHYCLNVVSGGEGVGEAVLIRALEPVAGLDIMRRRRAARLPEQLCSGPGKLTAAFGLNKKHNNLDLTAGPLYVYSQKDFRIKFGIDTPKIKHLEIVAASRIGITQGQELPLRFYIKDNPCVSFHVKH